MFDIDDPVAFLAVVRQWIGEDQHRAPVALVRLCEWAVEGAFAPSGFHKTTGERVDPLDVLNAARAMLKGESFTEQWNVDDRGLHPVTGLPGNPREFLGTLVVSAADAKHFRERFAPPPPFRGLFGSIVGRRSAGPPTLPPRCPNFEDVETRAKEDRLQAARTAFSQCAPAKATSVALDSAEPCVPIVVSPHQPAEAAPPPSPEPPPAVTGTPGRPSHIDLVVAEFRRRIEAGDIASSLAEQSRLLEDWFHQTHPGKQAPTAKTIENRLRTDYRQAANAPAALRNHPPKIPPELS